jgi:hypothetical protein
MKNKFIAKTTLLIFLLLFGTTFLTAQTTTFAQFTERLGGNDFVFTNNTTNASFETVAGGSPVSFTYLNASGLPAELQGPQDARVFLIASTSASAVTGTGNRTIQPFDGTFTIQIVRDTPFNGRTNLLTATVTPIGTSNSELGGDEGSSSAGYSASTPVQNVTFTSEFISFAGSTSRDFGLAFSSVTPIYSLGGTFLNSFTAAGAGTFGTNQAPTFMLIPTAATVSVSGQVLTPRGKGLAYARVTLTDSSGATFTTLTDETGYYQFSDVVAGETVVIEVKSKLYVYPAQVLNLSEETNGLNFVTKSARQRRQ